MADGKRSTADQGHAGIGIEVAFGPALVPSDVEAALDRLGLGRDLGGDLGTGTAAGDPGRGWIDQVGGGAVRFDLGGVGAADFAALAHLAVLVEGMVRHGRRVEVVLPVPQMVDAELRRLDERPELASALRAQVEVRSAARQFLRRSGFEEAVHCAHVPEAAGLVAVREADDAGHGDGGRADTASPGNGTAIADPAPIPVLPLQWLPPWSGDGQRTAWEREASEELGRTIPGLTVGEARALSELLVRELVDNVHIHAGGDRSRHATAAPAALVGAVLVDGPGPRTFPVGTIAGPGVPVLRLVVGDSGVGLAVSRSEWFGRRAGALANGRRSHDDETPGLSNVRRLVHESHGSLLVRSGDRLGGILFPGGDRQTVAKADCAWSPGTFVDVAVPPRATPAAGDRSQHGRRATPEGLVVLPLTPDGRAIDVEAALRLVDDRLGPAPSGFLVAALPPVEMAGTTAERVFDQISLLAEVVAGDVGLVVMAAAASGNQLFPLARAYDESRSRDLDAEPTPVMLRDEQGRTAWLGAGTVTGRLLALLTAEHDHRPTIGEVATRLATSAATVAQAVHGLRLWVETDAEPVDPVVDAEPVGPIPVGRVQLDEPVDSVRPAEPAGPTGPAEPSGSGEAGEAADARAAGVTIGLRLTPAAIDAALPQLLRAQLRAALALPSVARHGAFVTPTLERLSMWVDGAELIEAMGGSHLVGYTLATLVRTHHPDLDLGDALLVRLGTHLPIAFARAFGDTLGLRPKLYRVSGEAGFVDDPELLPVSRDTPVVLLTDVMVSGNTVRGAVVDMIRHGARPRLVVALVDYGRAGATERFLEPSPELVTLAAVTNPEPPDDVTPAVIDPLRSRKGLDYLPPALTYRLDRDDLLRWCGECRESILTGHIARLARRHFSTFLNAAALLRTGSPSAEAISAAVAGDIVDHLPDHDFRHVELWYPGSAGDVAGVLAHLVAGRLSSDPAVGGHEVRLVGVERVLTGGRWVFPLPAVPVDPGAHVVVVDWGSVTTHTLNDLVGRAADAGAASVHAVVFASQLSPEDEAAVRRIRFLVRQARAGTPGGEGEALAARVSFVSSFSVGYDSAAACRLCRLVDEYEREALAAPAAELREHAARMAALLEPTALHDAQARGARDLFGHDLTPAEATGIIRWRHDLAATLTDTARRRALLDRLQDLSTDDQHELVALVRLLVLEPRWLKLPPLRITSVRGVLAGATTGLVRDGRFDRLPVSVQRQLVIVLRMVSKGTFLDLLPDLVDPGRRVGLPPDVVTEVLFGAYTIVDRSYHHRRPIMATARAALSDALRRAGLAGLAAGDDDPARTATVLTSILALCDRHDPPAPPTPN